jgi:integrase
VRDCPSLVGGRPAKSVVERPRGFKSHIPRQCSNTPLVSFMKMNVREVTATTYMKRLQLLSKIGNLDNPEQIKNLICTYQCTESFKELLTNSYDYYVKFKGLSWVKPRFVRQDVPIFVPLESELDMLIGRARLKMSVFLELLKECGCDAGEAWKLGWIDLNAESKTVAITPTKNHLARTLPISNHLLSRFNQLPRANERVFGCKANTLDDFRRRYEDMKNALATKLQNPRIKQIAFSNRYLFTNPFMALIKVKQSFFWGHRLIENSMTRGTDYDKVIWIIVFSIPIYMVSI